MTSYRDARKHLKSVLADDKQSDRMKENDQDNMQQDTDNNIISVYETVIISNNHQQ